MNKIVGLIAYGMIAIFLIGLGFIIDFYKKLQKIEENRRTKLCLLITL